MALLLVVPFELATPILLAAVGIALFRLARLLGVPANDRSGAAEPPTYPGLLSRAIAESRAAARAVVGTGRRRGVVIALIVLGAWLLAGIAVSRGLAVGFEGYDSGLYTDAVMLLEPAIGAAALVLALAGIGWTMLYVSLTRRTGVWLGRLLGQGRYAGHTILHVLTTGALLYFLVRPVRWSATVVYLSVPRSRYWISGEGGVNPALLRAVDEVLTSPLLLASACWLTQMIVPPLVVAVARKPHATDAVVPTLVNFAMRRIGLVLLITILFVALWKVT